MFVIHSEYTEQDIGYGETDDVFSVYFEVEYFVTTMLEAEEAVKLLGRANPEKDYNYTSVEKHNPETI